MDDDKWQYTEERPLAPSPKPEVVEDCSAWRIQQRREIVNEFADKIRASKFAAQLASQHASSDGFHVTAGYWHVLAEGLEMAEEIVRDAS